MAKLETKLRKNKLFGSAELEARYKLYKEKVKLEQKQEELTKKLKECRTMIMKV